MIVIISEHSAPQGLWADQAGPRMRYEPYPSYELTTQVNESHFISQSWNSYLNITEMNNGKLGYQEFPNIVTCTRDPLKPTRTGLSMAGLSTANSDLCRRSGPWIPGLYY